MAGLARSDTCAGEATNALEVMDCALSKDSALSSLPAVVTVTVITTVPSTGVKDKPSETLALPTLHREVDEAGDDNSDGDGPATASCDGMRLTSAGIDGEGEHFSSRCERKSSSRSLEKSKS